jgi:hypothetical protein
MVVNVRPSIPLVANICAMSSETSAANFCVALTNEGKDFGKAVMSGDVVSKLYIIRT